MNEMDVVLTKEEIMEFIVESSKREVTIETLAEKLGLSPLEVLGYISIINKDEKKLAVSKKDHGITVFNNGDRLYTVDTKYVLPTNEKRQKKILLISDTRFGSKFCQKKFLNDVYLKAYDEGYDTVFHAGNITEGLYNMDNEVEYYDDLYAQDTMEQVEDVAENYPYIEGMKTYFIMGPKDKKHLTKRKINIGKRISLVRDDMIFLGANRAEIFVDNVAIIIQNLKLEKTYTISYRPEQSIKAIRSEDKPDILIYGGLCQLDSFYSRNILEFSVPSLVSTTTEMSSKRRDNVIGAQFLTITTKPSGKLLDVDCYDRVLYESSDDDYKKVKTLKLSKGGR